MQLPAMTSQRHILHLTTGVLAIFDILLLRDAIDNFRPEFFFHQKKVPTHSVAYPQPRNPSKL